MKPIISLERRDAILALSNKRTQAICALEEAKRLLDVIESAIKEYI